MKLQVNKATLIDVGVKVCGVAALLLSWAQHEIEKKEAIEELRKEASNQEETQ